LNYSVDLLYLLFFYNVLLTRFNKNNIAFRKLYVSLQPKTLIKTFMRKIALYSALIGFVCFLASSVSAQTTTPSATQSEKKVATRTSLTPAVAKTLPADSTVKVTPAGTTGTAATASDKTTTTTGDTKCQKATMSPSCQKKCAGSSTKCSTPCADKKTDAKDTKTVVPKN
jgi:hypothetical protein